MAFLYFSHLLKGRQLLCTTCLAVTTTLASSQGEGSTYAATDLKKDLTALRFKLEKAHPGLYTYRSRERINEVFDSLSAGINSPMTATAFYHHITILSSVIGDGHTIILPAGKERDQQNNEGLFLPYKFAINGTHLWVEQVCTSDNQLREGAEILSINGIDAATLVKSLIDRQVRDGNNQTYPRWIIDRYFRDYYSFHFGHPPSFSFRFRFDKKVQEATVAALSRDSIIYYRQSRYPQASYARKPKDGIRCTIDRNADLAVLTIRDFHKNILRKEYKQDFEKEIDRAFKLITDSAINKLVLDLRDNQGGDIDYAVYLLRWLLPARFQVVTSYNKVNKHGHNRLKQCNGPALGNQDPRSNHFQGPLVVLMNGGSFSNSGIVCAALKRYDRAVFIGEESGGNNSLLCGDVSSFSLPTTGIEVQVPTRQFVLDKKNAPSTHGTLPDQPYQRSIDELLSHRDGAMELARQLLHQQK